MTVEKFIISKNSSNYTIIQNNVLQGLRNCEALGLYCYLASLPPGWEFYKSHLQKHFNFGRDKIDKLLSVLKRHCLIKTTAIRSLNGQFAHADLCIDDGTSFIIPVETTTSEKHVQPYTEKPLTDNHALANSTYKDNNNKNNIKINKSSCASDDAPPKIIESRFLEFWEHYPRKKNKLTAVKIWNKHKCDVIADKIIEDIQNRLKNDIQWQNVQFIPHPATYLNNERWKDDITEVSNATNKGSNQFSPAQQALQRGWEMLKQW